VRVAFVIKDVTQVTVSIVGSASGDAEPAERSVGSMKELVEQMLSIYIRSFIPADSLAPAR
jgi:hypothetical protein